MVLRLDVRLAEAGADLERLDALRRNLRSELLELDVDDVQQGRSDGPAPPGARAVDVMQVDALVVAMTAAAPVVTGVSQVLCDWLRRAPHRSVEIAVGDQRLTLNDATPEQQDRLVELFAGTLDRAD